MGVPVSEISKRIGHSSPKTTMDTYSHIFDINQEKFCECIKFMVRVSKVNTSFSLVDYTSFSLVDSYVR